MLERRRGEGQWSSSAVSFLSCLPECMDGTGERGKNRLRKRGEEDAQSVCLPAATVPSLSLSLCTLLSFCWWKLLPLTEGKGRGGRSERSHWLATLLLFQPSSQMKEKKQRQPSWDDGMRCVCVCVREREREGVGEE